MLLCKLLVSKVSFAGSPSCGPRHNCFDQAHDRKTSDTGGGPCLPHQRVHNLIETPLVSWRSDACRLKVPQRMGGDLVA